MAGFLLHENKSVQVPVQCIEHLGFIIDSRTMMLEVPVAKEERIRKAVKDLIRDIQSQKRVSIRRLARVIGLLVSVLPAVKYGKAHYRALERAKISALSGSGNFDRKCRWPRWCLSDLKWWRSCNAGWKCSFETQIPAVTIITDASLEGWGAIWGDHEIFGPWDSETEEQIDQLELAGLRQCYTRFNAGQTIGLGAVMSNSGATTKWRSRMSGIWVEEWVALIIGLNKFGKNSSVEICLNWPLM